VLARQIGLLLLALTELGVAVDNGMISGCGECQIRPDVSGLL
jgi:hypothetical protein